MLLRTEGVSLVFTDGAVAAIAQVAEDANKLLDNIGARRLYTVRGGGVANKLLETWGWGQLAVFFRMYTVKGRGARGL